MDEILLNKRQKISDEMEASELLDSDYDENEIYQVENMTKEKLNGVSVFLNATRKVHMGLKTKMI